MTSRRPDPSGVAAIVLAAGGSTRMGGRSKLLLPLGGRPVVAWAVDAALDAPSVATVHVVVGAAGAAVRAALEADPRAGAAARAGRLLFVVSPAWAEGQGASLRAGLASLPPDAGWAAILLGDQPAVRSRVVERVVAAARRAARPIVRPVFHATPSGAPVPGHPVLLHVRVWDAALALTGDEGVRALVRVHPEWLATLDEPGPAPPDVDTPEAYAAVRAAWPRAAQ